MLVLFIMYVIFFYYVCYIFLLCMLGFFIMNDKNAYQYARQTY